jgi:hypothetical protein
MSAFKLADSDIYSGTWAKVAKRLHERIEELRVTNDNPLLDPVMTANTRGRIAELKLLLQAAEKSPPPVDLG